MHPTNTFSISRTAKKLLEKIDRMGKNQQKLSQYHPSSDGSAASVG
jgi:hypothetical protein